ncbi:MAG: phosphate ABC transporter permease PstA [Acholeplasma sp.]|nr:phosphate ABC transporter permease PstA [Acholeplasma sp.]
MKTKRIIRDSVLKGITYIASFISIIILVAILFFIFAKGSKGLTWDFITGDNEPKSYTISILSNNELIENDKYENYAKRFGVAFEDSVNYDKEPVVKIVFVDDKSPLHSVIDSITGEKVSVSEGFYFTTFIEIVDDNGNTDYIYAREGAKVASEKLANAKKIKDWALSYEGGGIRGSIITTVYLVVLTLLIGFPIGILTAVYLHEIAPKNRFINILRSFIDMLTGVPSIIYGLLGAALLIPVSQMVLQTDSIGGNVLSGALTLSIMILPVVIKATESALDVVPKDYKLASLALGVNEVQTTFKVILPNAMPGILSAALLTIGRVIGESAALIYAIGTSIKDVVSIDGKGTSLAVHIWSVMAGENPNVEVATSIAIIILALVLVLNLIVKYISHRLDKKFKGV